MEQIINALIDTLVNSEAFRDALREAVMEGIEKFEVITKDDLESILVERDRSILQDVEEKVEEAIKEIDLEDPISEGIEEYFSTARVEIHPR